MDINSFDTGDILLFEGYKELSIFYLLDYLIEYFTNSKYCHTGMVVKNPKIDNKILKGLYLLESTGGTGIKDVTDNKTHFGVQLVPLKERLDKTKEPCYYRKLNCKRTPEFLKLFEDAYYIVRDKPYDVHPDDWIKSDFYIKLGNVQKTNTFFCSALVSYLLTKLEIIPNDTDWTLMRPTDLGTEKGSRLYIPQLNKEIQIK